MRRRRKPAKTDRHELWFLGVAMGFVLVIGVLAIWFSLTDDSEDTVLGVGTDLQLPLADLKKGELHLFTYPIDPATSAQLVVQRGKDGILRAAFAVCRRCSGIRHYEWMGQLICGHCGHAMQLPDPGEEPTEETGCVPVALPYSVEGNQLVVRGQAIKEKFHRWFQSPETTETN